MAGVREEPLQGSSTPYEKIKDLNKGAHGFVQLCRDKRTGRLCAVKFIERGEKVTHYVQREILNHRMLNHPHVIEFREVFLAPKYLGIAMEYAAGGDMFDYVVVRQKRLKEQFARWFFQQLIVALDYCHRKGVANRDIKLENTLLDHNAPPLLKLCDFGYSKNWTAGSAPRSLVGTPAYLAPEVICSIRGTTYDGQAADVWSAGVMLYVMLVGGYPFERQGDNVNGQALRNMYERIQAVDYHIPPSLGITPECQDLLARILVADPSKRISIPQIYQHPWFTSNLPAGVLHMNDNLYQQPSDLQPEAEILAILEQARQPLEGALITPHLTMGVDTQGLGAGNGAGPGGGNVWDTVDEYVDALVHPHQDVDQGEGAMLFNNDAARQRS